MSPHVRDEFLKLHPYQQQVFMEIIGWSNAGTEGAVPSDIAYEKALTWARQAEIPPPPPPKPNPGEE